MKDHADVLPEVRHVLSGVVDLLAPVGERACYTGAGDEVVHAVDGPQEGGLPAAGGSDQCGDPMGRDVQADVFQGAGLAVIEVQIAGGENGFRHRTQLLFSFLPAHAAARLIKTVKASRIVAMEKAIPKSARSFA